MKDGSVYLFKHAPSPPISYLPIKNTVTIIHDSAENT
jgi:hypothetical protein